MLLPIFERKIKIFHHIKMSAYFSSAQNAETSKIIKQLKLSNLYII